MPKITQEKPTSADKKALLKDSGAAKDKAGLKGMSFEDGEKALAPAQHPLAADAAPHRAPVDDEGFERAADELGATAARGEQGSTGGAGGGDRARLLGQVSSLMARLKNVDVKLVDGGDQTALEKGARKHFEGRHGSGAPEEVFEGSVAEQKAEANQFAGGLPPLARGDTSQYNLWSGMGKPGEKKEDTPRGKAEAQPGFVMQQTQDFAAAIWELRNVAGFIDSETKWPWDPGYHLTLVRWLEEQQASSGWPSEAEIAKKLDELRTQSGSLDSRVKIKEEDGGELIGLNRKIGDTIFEAPSADLATRVGRSMIPVQSYGLDTHENPRATVQWQVEIPNVIKQAESLQRELNELVAACKAVAAQATGETRELLVTLAHEVQTGAIRYKTGARMLKTAIDTPSEEWKQRVGFTNAELMRDGRDLLLQALTQLVDQLHREG